MSEGDKNVTNAQFMDHVNHFHKLMEENGLEIGAGLVMPDVSASMGGDPMAAAISLAILVSTLASGPWKDRAISFESEPHWLHFRYPSSKVEFDNIWQKKSHNGYGTSNSYSNSFPSHPFGVWDPKRCNGELTFCEKVAYLYCSPWGGSTDFLAVHDLMLDIAVKSKLTPEQMPKWFLCASDMQFNLANKAIGSRNVLCNLLGVSNWTDVERTYNGSNGRNARHKFSNYAQKTNNWQDHHSIIVEAYRRAGIKACGTPYVLPVMIYWNMRGTKTFVTPADTPGVQMVGGFSTMQLKIFLESMDLDPKSSDKAAVTPWETFQKAVNNECYNDIRKILSGFGQLHPKSVFFNYVLPPTLAAEVRPDGYDQYGYYTNSSDQNVTYDSNVSINAVNSISGSGSDPTHSAFASDGAIPDMAAVSPPVPPFSSASICSNSASTPLDKLQKTKQLLSAGLITQEDYDKVKNQVLANI